MGTTVGTRMKYAKSFLQYHQWALSLDLEYLELPTFVHYMFFVWDCGWSTQRVVEGLYAMDAVRVAACLSPWSKDSRVLFVLRKFRQAWRPLQRTPLAVALALRVMAKPPSSVNHFAWRVFIALGYVFLLRHGQARAVQPADVVRPSVGDPYWKLHVRSPKINLGGWQNVVLHESRVHPEMAKWVGAFAALRGEPSLCLELEQGCAPAVCDPYHPGESWPQG